ncbi:MAG TPA: S8 family peptidase [Pirellulaceae bacterium]|jgi:hypothetical protein|nr:S8 family peptidase [Pirellulaceae bacterium]
MATWKVTHPPTSLLLVGQTPKIAKPFAAVLDADAVLVGNDALGDSVLRVADNNLGALLNSATVSRASEVSVEDQIRPLNRITLAYDPNTPLQRNEVEALGVDIEEDYKQGAFLTVKLRPGTQVDQAFVLKLEALTGLVYGSPSFSVNALPPPGRGPLAPPRVALSNTPNDPMRSEQWGLAAIDVETAWNKVQGSNQIVVAVIDTGVDYTHPDLHDNMWQSTAGTFGKNFVDSNDDPMDDAGHGTHVAGIIGAVGNNGVGVAGVNWEVKLMALRWLNRFGQGEILNAVKAIDFAVSNGARIINASWYWYNEEPILDAAIKRANDAGVLFVVAAGNFALWPHNNDGDNDKLDTRGRYPSCLNEPNVVAVGAIREGFARASFSHWGKLTVDLFAPGESIKSTYAQQQYFTDSGTSMAAPYVSGALALVMAHPTHANAGHLLIKDLVLDNVNKRAEYTDRCRSEGTLSLAFLQ